MPRQEVLSPWISGAERDIAVLSRVGKPTCFQVTDIHADEKGAPVALLSRRAVQERALADFLEHLGPGSVVTAVVTRLESFGAFLDIGCGIVAMLPIEYISVSRISHPGERFRTGPEDPSGGAVRGQRAPPVHHDPPGAAGHLDGKRQPLPPRRDGPWRGPQCQGLWQLCGAGAQPLGPGRRQRGPSARGRRVCVHQKYPPGADEDQAPGH